MNISEYEVLFIPDTKIWGVFNILKDGAWHCRECEYRHLNITQIAGGSGIQGLQRGTSSRPGLHIDSANHFCQRCNRQTRQDKWNGQFVESMQASSMPSGFAKRVINILDSRDIVEGTTRPANQLTIDHKVPMLRWNVDMSAMQTDYQSMTDDDIRSYFQLLKKSNGSVSHNLLKSRACEQCYQQGRRGAPFGIKFYYSGNSSWEPEDKHDPSGCIGCGWHDFDRWRIALNEKIRQMPLEGGSQY